MWMRREAESLGITLVPMTVQFDTESFQDGVNLSHRQFFEKLIESDALPKTSQINAYQFEERFRELTSGGDEVVAITLSSKLSGTYFSAVQAAKRFEGRVYVVDSLNACIGERLLLHYALRLVQQPLSARAIAAQLDAGQAPHPPGRFAGYAGIPQKGRTYLPGGGARRSHAAC